MITDLLVCGSIQFKISRTMKLEDSIFTSNQYFFRGMKNIVGTWVLLLTLLFRKMEGYHIYYCCQ